MLAREKNLETVRVYCVDAFEDIWDEFDSSPDFEDFGLDAAR